jgi:subtilisin family serine protease
MFRGEIVRTICILVIASASIASGAAPGRAARRIASGADIVPGVVIVAMKDGTSALTGSAAGGRAMPALSLQKAGIASARQLFPDVFALKIADRAAALRPLARILECAIPSGADPIAVAEQLSRSPDVDYAEPKYLHTMCDSPNDPLLTSQNSAFTRLNAYAGWTIAKGSASVLIATVDGGTYWRHEDLLPNVRINTLEDVNKNGVFDAADANGVDDDGNGFIDDVAGWNFSNNTNDPTGLTAVPRSYAHGTATASHFGAVANNSIGIAGSSWNCALLPVCVASPTTDEVFAYGYEGIVYAAARGADVINCSWGRLGGYSRFEQEVIAAVTNGGALIVVAAGNKGVNTDLSPFYPANYEGVLAVGATASTSDAIALFSNYGMSVPVYAPGVGIWSAFIGGGYGNGGNGTSYSSPLVAGLAGILKAAHPMWTPGQIAAQIRSTADIIDNVNPGYAGLLSKGRVNFARALSENNPAVETIASTVRTPGGRTYFFSGDTILVTLTLKNPLFVAATNIEFSASSSSGAATLVDVPAQVSTLAPGQTVQPGPFRFIVGAVSSASTNVFRLRWTINGANGDGYAVTGMLFPVLPQWATQVDGANASLFSVNAVNPSVAWTSGGDGFGSSPLVLRTTDGGTTWLDRTGNLNGVDLYCIWALDANRAWAGTGRDTPGDGRIYATSDGGASWSLQLFPGRQTPFINGVWIFPDGTGYAQGDPPGDGKFVVLKTTDFGGNWSHVANEPQGTSGEAGWNNSFWWTDASHGWFGSNHSRVWRTTDGGTSWTSASTGGGNSSGVSFRDTSYGYASHDAGYAAHTTNGGLSWTALPSATSDNLRAVAAPPGSSSAWFVSASAAYQARNEGQTWATEGLFPVVGSLSHVSFADTTAGWVVTSYGEVLKYIPTTVTGVQGAIPVEVPAGIALLQNYPNPFNGSTRITYTLHGTSASRVTVRVFDLLGREVGLIADGMQEEGDHAVVFDARDHASGMYICVLDAVPVNGSGPIRLTRPMVLIR